MNHASEELQKSLRPISSLAGKTEKALQKLESGTWQHTMLQGNLKALQMASSLMQKNPGDSDRYTHTDFQEALHSLAAMMRKTVEAGAQFAPGTSQHTLLRNRLLALRVAEVLIKQSAT